MKEEKNVIMRSNREYDYFGNVLEYDYFALYSSMSMITQKVLVLVYEYEYRVRLLHLRNVVQVIHRVRQPFACYYHQMSVVVYKVVDQPGPVTSSVKCLTTNWNKCVLRQVDTPDVLRCPAYSKHDAEGVGYKTITNNINEFQQGCLLA